MEQSLQELPRLHLVPLSTSVVNTCLDSQPETQTNHKGIVVWEAILTPHGDFPIQRLLFVPHAHVALLVEEDTVLKCMPTGHLVAFLFVSDALV